MKLTELIEELQKQMAEKNVNFFIGSGASVPFFPSLGNIEMILTERDYHPSVRHLIYLYYFNEIIDKNIELIDFTQCETGEQEVTNNYRNFIKGITNTMNFRNSRISPRRMNLFTTNYDMFFEKAIDLEQKTNPSLTLNDGGNGYFIRTLSSDNFHKTISRNGVFDNYHRELPTINLIKCHGSVNWVKGSSEGNEKVEIRNDLISLKRVRDTAKELHLEDDEREYIKAYLTDQYDDSINTHVHKIAEKNQKLLESFFNEYEKLMIINPEKSKFENTVMDEYYYSMLRLLSYELEKDQTILIVFGFSFADEHIRNLIKRSFHNPGLRIYIFVYKNGMREDVMRLLDSEYKTNVVVIEPEENMTNIDLFHFNKLLFEGVLL